MSKRDSNHPQINTTITYDLKPIISVKEARKLLGKKVSDQLSDEVVGELIGSMSSLADRLLEVKTVPQNKKTV